MSEEDKKKIAARKETAQLIKTGALGLAAISYLAVKAMFKDQN